MNQYNRDNNYAKYELQDFISHIQVPALGAGGPRFESWHPDTKNQAVRVKSDCLFHFIPYNYHVRIRAIWSISSVIGQLSQLWLFLLLNAILFFQLL